MSGDEFKAQDTTYFNQGLRVSELAIREGKFAAVWQPGNGTQWIRWGMSGDEFKAQDTTYFGQGLRITSLEIEGGRIAAVWRPGGGTQWVRWGMSGDEFKAQDTTYFDQGLRIACLAIENGKIAAVWRPASGAQWVRWGMSSDDFAAQDRTYFPQGLRITSLVYDAGKYAAVWQPGSGEQWWSTRRGAVDFKTEDGAYFARGLRIVCLELQDDPIGAYRYPWKGGVSYSVTQGNNNPSGSHNGSQAWAFDFGLPSGTEIRAARDGTVEWLQENQTANFNPNNPPGPGQPALPRRQPAELGQRGADSARRRVHQLVFPYPDQRRGRERRRRGDAGAGDRALRQHRPLLRSAPALPGAGGLDGLGTVGAVHVRQQLRAAGVGCDRDVRQRLVTAPALISIHNGQ